MIVEYAKQGKSVVGNKGPSYGPGDKFPEDMESVQTYPREQGREHTDEAFPRYANPSNQSTPLEPGQVEYPRSDVGEPYDPTVPMTREGDTLDKRTR